MYDEYKCLIAPLLIDASVDVLNDAYVKAVINIESQALKKKSSKAIFGVGDVTQHCYADLVFSGIIMPKRSSFGING